jgi:putative membrane protein
MMKKRPVLVLCIDRDNDLYEKGKVSGPLIGRERNLEGATALALADPEDPDSNAIFYAIKVYDKMRTDGHPVEVVTLTGDRKLGYKADREVSSQLDKVVAELNPTSCVLISDGASDEEMIPVIKSRMKIDSTKIVFIKQAKELEKTYFVLLEKLRDPSFAKTIIGIPALLLLLTAISIQLGLGWPPIVVIVALYALMHVYGVEEALMDLIKDFRFSFERTSWIGYLGSAAVFAVGLFVGYQTFQKGIAMNLANDKLIALLIGSISWIFFTGVLLILAGKSIDAIIEKKKFKVTKYMLYSTAATLSTFVMVVGSSWIVNLNEPYVDFGTFLLSIALALVVGYVVTSFINWYRQEILLEMKIEGKEAISEHGVYLGKIVGIDAKRGKLIIQTIFDKRYALSISAVSSIDENVVVRSGE